MSILDHGVDVFSYFQDLYDHVFLGTTLKKIWKLPEWIYSLDWLQLLLYSTIQDYLVYHDCGKPLCRIVDDEDRQHFPNHASVSYKRWLQYSDDQIVANLILMDMDVHTMRAESIPQFLTRREALTLLIAGLCEIHSNSVMFGGIDTTSFKIKYKKIDRIGKQMVMEKQSC